MSNLNCNATTCSYNQSNHCCLNSIGVEGKSACCVSETNCGSYNDSNMSAMNSCCTPKSSLNVSCEASNCMYNMNNHCEAEHVDISGIKATNAKDTVCTTFQSRS